MSLLSHRPYSHLDNEEDKFPHDGRKLQSRTKLLRCLLSAVVVLSLLLAGVVAAAVQVALFSSNGTSDGDASDARRESSSAFEDALVVRTSCGEYVGTIEDGAFVFKGIPYAKAPVGHLRWKKPVPWWSDGEWCGRRERRRAHKPGRPCFHLDPETRRERGAEDCLYLNVWSPRLDTSAGLDVLVWFHGGFLQWGSGHEPGLGPTGRVAKRLNAVLVSFNYRLGALGFLALDLLVEQPRLDARGNYALWDQLVALRWVRRNIRAFGGDPHKVTLFGADGGAACISALAASEAARGLFRATWLIGPAVTFDRRFEEASQQNRASFVARSGCSNATCLRRLSAGAVARTHLWKDEPSFRIRDQNDLPIQGIRPQQLIVVDDDLLQSSPTEALQQSHRVDLPALVGTAAQATDTWPGPDDLPSWRWGQLTKYVVTSLDSFGPGISQEALQQYNSSEFNDFSSPEEVYSSMVSDLRQTCPVHRLYANLSSVYRYVVVARPSSPVKMLGYPASYAFHPWDAVAFFDHMEHFLESPSPEDFRFRDQMHRVVRAFVRSAGRRGPVPLWRPFPENLALVSDSDVSVVDAYHRAKCDFWEQRGFSEYAWVS